MSLLAVLAISSASASKEGFHGMPDGPIMPSSDSRDTPTIDLDLQEESPAGHHLMADGSFIRDSDTKMAGPTVEVDLDRGIPAEHRLMADGASMDEDSALDEELQSALVRRVD